MKRSPVMATLFTLMLGCGSAPATVPPGASAASEGEELPEPALRSERVEPGASNDEAVPPQGPASIRVDVTVKGEPVPAEILILDGDQTVARGNSGEAVTTTAGQHTMLVRVLDKLVDRPEQRQQLTLLPGEIVQKLRLPWALVQLRVRVNGSLNRAATVDILRDGEVVATFKSDAPHAFVTPGRYQAIVHVRGAKIEVPALMFPSESTKSVPVDVRM